MDSKYIAGTLKVTKNTLLTSLTVYSTSTFVWDAVNYNSMFEIEVKRGTDGMSHSQVK